MAVNKKTGVSQAAHRFAAPGQQQTQDVTTEVDKTWFGKVRLK
jgi:hypothetical protein